MAILALGISHRRATAEPRGGAPAALPEPLYAHYEEEAVRHLFDVAAGLDSMVIGEPQILSQVRDAFRRAEAEGAAGPTLTPPFHAAGARRARAARGDDPTGDGRARAAAVPARPRGAARRRAFRRKHPRRPPR